MSERLPPLKALVAFESVVRLGSVTAAAEELFVTHSAVSKQIALLEGWMGQPLFRSNRKRMQPTAEAAALAEVTERAFGLIAEASAVLRRGEAAETLRVIAPSTFAMRWLIPRVWSFSRARAPIALQVRPTDSLEDWQEIPFDVAIRTDPRAPRHLEARPFLAETLVLAAAPRFLAARRLAAPRDLAATGVIRAATRPGQLEAWSAAAGLDRIPDGPSFPHFYLALEAALAGEGPLVSPFETLCDLFAKGELVALWPDIRVAGPTHVALFDAAAPHAGAAEAFIDWLTATAGESRPAAKAA
ncbi:LysR substrate-binding domain-containing protein [Prosthecomicrobium pneumaticum]|uniref:DNA-binding transcriptional LysR family regulator n=1 Tax=Prosthecomicrobium pneumaticum TaxID=81895 RepID=A0A7W9L2A5_9HYPH|nr:LysR substrate-binding domain-containing protein [Prosthecomicrobium pneumaticum]MBB5753354.1 DNA-binding transcriptional LysR family regulator [Prosthecomicrobium pneumaticum]